MPPNHATPNKRKKRPASYDGAGNPLAFAVNDRDQNVMAMVKTALDHEQAMLAFQPIVQTNAPDRVAFHEGLIRIRDATGRIIPAKDFMGTVEDTEVGRRIDCLALDLGLRELCEQPSLRLSINMSARSVGYAPWMTILNNRLAEDPTVAERLILEITESSAIAVPELVVSFMDRLQDRGVSFALDDFGAGFTSFRYLRDFYFDILKIDGQFVQGVHKDPDNQVLLTALVSIGKHFEMFTVAEHVEDAADLAFLQHIGIDCLQGYLLGAPTISPAWRETSKRKRA